MDSRGRMILTWISGIVIVTLSLLVAYVCFVILGSSAEGTLRNWKLGGGLAGFIVTATFLASTLTSFYRLLTADQIADYQKQIHELQTKLIKGAPCPPGYTIDVDERHRIVFARPKPWVPRGGMLYQYVEPLRKGDKFAATFNVQYIREEELTQKHQLPAIDGTSASVDKYYEAEINEMQNTIDANVSREHITVDGLRSAKCISTWNIPIGDDASEQKPPPLIKQIGVITYVPELKIFFVFSFGDDAADFFESSIVFNNIISSIRFL